MPISEHNKIMKKNTPGKPEIQSKKVFFFVGLNFWNESVPAYLKSLENNPFFEHLSFTFFPWYAGH